MESIFKIFYFLVASDPQYATYRDDLLGLNGAETAIFQNTILTVLLTTAGMAAIYYLLLCRYFKLNYIWIWLLLLLVAGIAGFAISYGAVGTYLFQLPDPIGPIGWRFIGTTTFYALLLFYLFSLLFKRWSNFAKFTPH
jgi:hypothetical protein